MRVTLRLPLIVVSAFIAFAVLTSALLIFVGRRALADSELEHLSRNAADYAAAIQFYLKSASDELELAAQTIDPDSIGQEFGSGIPGRNVLAFVMGHASVFEFLLFARVDGTIVSIEPRELDGNLYRRNVAFRDWFQALLASGAPVVSNLHISLATSRPAVTVAVPIFGRERHIAGLLAGSIKLQDLSRAGSGALDQGAARQFGYLTDSHGLVMAHQSKPNFVTEQTDFSSEPTVRNALAGRQGAISFFDPVEKEWMLGAFLPIHLGPAAAGRTWAVCFAVPQSAAFAPIGAFSRTIAASAALFALGFGLFSFILIRRFVAPLDQLTLAVRKAGTGDFSHRVRQEKQDEFSSLAEAYNSMAFDLSEKEQRIIAHEAQLRQANLRLEESNRELEAFSYSVSHDLRAPLRAIDGFSHALLEDYGSVLGAEGQDHLTRVRRGVQAMGDLIEDMLKLSRVNRAELTSELIDLTALARTQAEDMTARDPGREAEFIIAPSMTAQGDRRLVQILIGNLMDNAWKFTKSRPKARIEIGRLTENGTAAFFVRDNGVGFDMKYVGKLFSAFQRLHERAEYEGTGIGLVIVNRIAIRHGGRAWAEAEVGKGATFFFSLSEKGASGHE